MDNVMRHRRDNNARFSRHGDYRGGIAKGFLIIPVEPQRSKKIIRSTSPNLLVLLSHVFVGAGHDFAHGDAGLDIL